MKKICLQLLSHFTVAMEPEDDGILLQTRMNNAEQNSYSKVYSGKNESLLKPPFPAPQEYNFDLKKIFVKKIHPYMALKFLLFIFMLFFELLLPIILMVLLPQKLVSISYLIHMILMIKLTLVLLFYSYSLSCLLFINIH